MLELSRITSFQCHQCRTLDMPEGILMFAMTDTQQRIDTASIASRDRSATDTAKALDSSGKPSDAIQSQMNGAGENSNFTFLSHMIIIK